MPGLTIAAMIGVVAAWAARAEPSALPPKPYRPVEIVLPPAAGDAALERLREELAAAARRRVYADLARLVVPQGFFWERDFARRNDGRRPGVDNLAAAVRLEAHDGAGWNRLAAFAAEASAEPLVSRPGVVCAPAPPRYDVVAFARLVDETFTDGAAWAYPRAAQVPVHPAPRAEAVQVTTLGLHFVRVLAWHGEGGDGPREFTRWARIVAPAGETGFVRADRLAALGDARICYGKDAFGRWSIAGYIDEEPRPKPQP